MADRKVKMKRLNSEKIFLYFFIPGIMFFYLLYKYPLLFVDNVSSLMPFGKNISFWYALIYTAIVSIIATRIIISKTNVYSVNKKHPGLLSRYQFWKFSAILMSQLVVYFLIPFIVAPVLSGQSFWNDLPKVAAKSAHIYMYPGFLSWGMAVYLFLFIPLIVYFFGKRYCTWFCSCGNLAETIGVTKWGKKWLQKGTPRSEVSKKWEHLQTAILVFSLFFGLILLIDGAEIVAARGFTAKLQFTQDLLIDFMFGAVVGISAYPFFGTRIWCRYGCPMAKGMQLFGKYAGSRTKVQGNKNCKGMGVCSRVCPMGIDVASYVHKDKKPTLGSFGQEEPCIACGSCIAVCPVNGLEFGKILKNKETFDV